MSGKGNSPDNGMMESFFGILKSEMFYGYERHFKSIKELEGAIVDYIDYYNNKRIKVKLKDLVLYNTELNPLLKLVSNFLGSVHIWSFLLYSLYTISFYFKKCRKNTQLPYMVIACSFLSENFSFPIVINYST